MMVNLAAILQRSVHMQELQRHDQKIRIETSFDQYLPRVCGDGHRFYRCWLR